MGSEAHVFVRQYSCDESQNILMAEHCSLGRTSGSAGKAKGEAVLRLIFDMFVCYVIQLLSFLEQIVQIDHLQLQVCGLFLDFYGKGIK